MPARSAAAGQTIDYTWYEVIRAIILEDSLYFGLQL